MTNTAIAGEEQEEDLVDREALVTLSEAPVEDGGTTKSVDYWLVILISAVAVIILGIGVVCLVLKKKRIAVNGGGG